MLIRIEVRHSTRPPPPSLLRPLLVPARRFQCLFLRCIVIQSRNVEDGELEHGSAVSFQENSAGDGQRLLAVRVAPPLVPPECHLQVPSGQCCDQDCVRGRRGMFVSSRGSSSCERRMQRCSSVRRHASITGCVECMTMARVWGGTVDRRSSIVRRGGNRRALTSSRAHELTQNSSFFSPSSESVPVPASDGRPAVGA